MLCRAYQMLGFQTMDQLYESFPFTNSFILSPIIKFSMGDLMSHPLLLTPPPLASQHFLGLNIKHSLEFGFVSFKPTLIWKITFNSCSVAKQTTLRDALLQIRTGFRLYRHSGNIIIIKTCFTWYFLGSNC